MSKAPSAPKVQETPPAPSPPEETAETPEVEGPGRSERKAAKATGSGKSSLRIDLNLPTKQTQAQTVSGLNIPQG